MEKQKQEKKTLVFDEFSEEIQSEKMDVAFLSTSRPSPYSKSLSFLAFVIGS